MWLLPFFVGNVLPINIKEMDMNVALLDKSSEGIGRLNTIDCALGKYESDANSGCIVPMGVISSQGRSTEGDVNVQQDHQNGRFFQINELELKTLAQLCALFAPQELPEKLSKQERLALSVLYSNPGRDTEEGALISQYRSQFEHHYCHFRARYSQSSQQFEPV